MLDFPTWKRLWYWALTLVFAIAALPSLVSVGGLPWPDALPDPKVNLGLDLAGGSHILLEANPEQVKRQRLENMEESVRARLRVIVRRTLRQYGYPPDMQQLATDTVLQQAEMIAHELMAS